MLNPICLNIQNEVTVKYDGQSEAHIDTHALVIIDCIQALPIVIQ